MKFIKGDRNKRCIGILVLLLSLAISIQAVVAKDENNITTSGVLTYNETWSDTVHITGDVVIPEGITLVIQPGTIITFTPDSSDNDVKIPVLEKLGINKCNLIVKGNLRMEGEKDNKVIVGEFSYDVNRDTAITWGGIIFEGVNAVSIVRYAKIRYADVAIVCLGSSSPKIVNNTIAENDVGVMTFGFSSPRINENKIHHNTLWAISCYDYSFPMINKNIITASLVGIGSQDFSFPTISYNTLRGNKVGILFQDSAGSSILKNYFQNNTKRLRDDRKSQ